MGFLDKVFNKKPRLTVKEKIPVEAEKAAEILKQKGYRADYTIQSLMDVDRFIDDESHPKGLFHGNIQPISFSLGCYVGETLIKNYGGKWVIFENDLDHSNVRVADEILVKPVIKCQKRYSYGEDESIYEFALEIKKNVRSLKEF